MANPMTDDMVVKAIGKEFQQEYEEVRRTRLQSWEQVFAASWCSMLARREHRSSLKQYWNGDEYTEDFGFCFVTTHRVVCCRYRSASARGRLYYGIYDGIYDSHRKSLITDVSPLTPEELATRVFEERPLKDIERVTAEDFLFSKNGKQYKLTELPGLIAGSFGFPPVFLADSGQAVYGILQLAMANGGRVPSDAPPAPRADDPLTMLERLTALWKVGGLSDEEFRIAKRKLLGM